MVDGAALPVCQRCFGLYLGALATGVWLVGSGLWRRGLPGWGVLGLHAGMLAAAMLGGLRVIDGGPVWRAICGAWTGHVAVAWLVGGGVHLWRLRRFEPPLPWRRRDKLQAAAAAGVLTAAATLAPTQEGWWLWSGLAAAGAVTAALVLTACAAASVGWLVAVVRAGRTAAPQRDI